MILNAVCPSPASFVPKGARNARLGFFRNVVPVEIREISLVEVARVRLDCLHADMGPGGLLSYDGALWKPLGVSGAAANRDDLAALIEDRDDLFSSQAMRNALRAGIVRTPLGALDVPRDHYLFPSGFVPERGAPRGPMRHLLSDGTEASVALASSHVESSYLVAGGHAYVRTAPLAWVTVMGSSVHTGIWVDVTDKRTVRDPNGLPATPATLSQVEEILLGDGSAKRARGLSQWRDLPEWFFGNAAEEAVANALPGALRHCLVRGMRCEPALMEGLTAMDIRSRTMSLVGSDLAQALRTVAEGCDVVDGNLRSEGGTHTFPGPAYWAFPNVARVVREAMLPALRRRLGEDEMAEEDVQSLGRDAFGP